MTPPHYKATEMVEEENTGSKEWWQHLILPIVVVENFTHHSVVGF